MDKSTEYLIDDLLENSKDYKWNELKNKCDSK